jgi:Flp pilus assembly protein TadG
LAVELLLVLPLFLLFLAGMIEFSLLLTARQELLAASREGARVASHGADCDEVIAVVRRCLGKGSLRHANVDIQHFDEDCILPNCRRDRVQVVVHIESTKVTPDFLAMFGITFCNKRLAAGTVMCMEGLTPRQANPDDEHDGDDKHEKDDSDGEKDKEDVAGKEMGR